MPRYNPLYPRPPVEKKEALDTSWKELLERIRTTYYEGPYIVIDTIKISESEVARYEIMD